MTINKYTALRTEALCAGDYMQVALCDIAVSGACDDADIAARLSITELSALADMSINDARTACLIALNHGNV